MFAAIHRKYNINCDKGVVSEHVGMGEDSNTSIDKNQQVVGTPTQQLTSNSQEAEHKNSENSNCDIVDDSVQDNLADNVDMSENNSSPLFQVILLC